MKVNIESIASRVPAMIYVYAVNHETGESSFPYVSDYCETMFGFPSSVVMEDPKRLVNCILEDEAEQYAAAVMESMEHLTPFDRLGHMRRADGTIINVHYKSMPRLVQETNKDGSSVTFTVWDGIVFDVTSQVTNKENNTTRTQRMVDESLQPIFEIDIHECITEWNDTMARITGYSREEVLGAKIVDLMPKHESRNFASPFSEEDRSQCDCVFLSKKDKRLYLHATCTASNDENGACKGKMFCCQDVTSLREAEKQKNAALELADAERGLTEWLSHEVRNPLSVAMEAARTLKEGEDDALLCVDLICESIRYIVDLLTNMLDLNKCLDGKIALFPVSCRIREEILVPTCKMMNVSKRHSLVNLQLEDGEEVVSEIDKLRLRQVITNIISNSLKFTSKGFVKVRLEQQILGPKKRIVRISISDSGCGIKASDHDALFSKWEQLGSKVNGTGIGLCLSQALVKAMGGRIYLDKDYVSGLDGRPGARFVIDLPYSILPKRGTESIRMPAFESLSAAVVASRTAASAQESDAIEPTRHADLYISVNSSQTSKIVDIFIQGRFKLLVIDDDKMGRKLLTRRFSRLFPQAEIDELASGEEALIEVENTNYDIITVDHFMAVDEMSGEETIRELRSRGIDSLIVGISGNAFGTKHREAGAEDFFQKPIPGDDEIVQRLISKLSPPSSWRVLCVDDAEVNLRFLCRRLHKLASPHFTSLAVAEKRWTIITKTSGEEAVDILRDEWFDLVVLDYHLGDGIKGHSVADFVRKGSVNKDAIVVLNSGSVQRLQKGNQTPYNIVWPKPLPSNEQMRLDLCKELLKSKSGGSVERES